MRNKHDWRARWLTGRFFSSGVYLLRLGVVIIPSRKIKVFVEGVWFFFLVLPRIEMRSADRREASSLDIPFRNVATLHI